MKKMIDGIDYGKLMRETVGDHRLLLMPDGRLSLVCLDISEHIGWRENCTYDDFDAAVARLEDFYEVNSDWLANASDVLKAVAFSVGWVSYILTGKQ